jgi:predicted helicase
MLLPYYIASMNIEHAYFDRVDEYRAFPGICLVDTFELAEAEQSSLGFMTEENAQRVKRQKAAPIFVIIGNPPYNAGQVNESDNNKNRKYPVIDGRISETYGKDSQATLLRKLQDPYVKAIRWATDRIGTEGIVCFVTNDSFINDHSLDGVRASLEWEFDHVYVLDLGGNVRKNPKLSGTTHNVFGIQVGVSINVFVRKHRRSKDTRCPIDYAAVDPPGVRSRSTISSAAMLPLAPLTGSGLLLTSATRGLHRDYSPAFQRLGRLPVSRIAFSMSIRWEFPQTATRLFTDFSRSL